MLFIRHPEPVVDGRAVAVQGVQQKSTQEVSRTVLIVETPVPAPSTYSDTTCTENSGLQTP
jgi:hypothetical protein